MRHQHQFICEVMDQKDCNKCWAVTLTQAIQDIIMIYTNYALLNENTPLSYNDFARDVLGQEDICTKAPPFKFAIEESFKKGFLCPSKGLKYYPKSYKRILNDGTVNKYISSGTPVMCLINIYPDNSFHNYKGGIYGFLSYGGKVDKGQTYRHSEYLNGIYPDGDKKFHSITLIGWGTATRMWRGRNVSVPYWIIRNSWGVQWGMNGYGYVLAGCNCCGIEEDLYILTI